MTEQTEQLEDENDLLEIEVSRLSHLLRTWKYSSIYSAVVVTLIFFTQVYVYFIQ